MPRKQGLLVLLLIVAGIVGWPTLPIFAPTAVWAADPVGPPPTDLPTPVPKTLLDLRGAWTGAFKSATASGYKNGTITVKITEFVPPSLFRGWAYPVIDGQEQPPETFTAVLTPGGILRMTTGGKIRTASLQFHRTTNLTKFPSGVQPALVGASQFLEDSVSPDNSSSTSFIWLKTTQ